MRKYILSEDCYLLWVPHLKITIYACKDVHQNKLNYLDI